MEDGGKQASHTLALQAPGLTDNTSAWPTWGWTSGPKDPACLSVLAHRAAMEVAGLTR